MDHRDRSEGSLVHRILHFSGSFLGALGKQGATLLFKLFFSHSIGVRLFQLTGFICCQ